MKAAIKRVAMGNILTSCLQVIVHEALWYVCGIFRQLFELTFFNEFNNFAVRLFW